MLLVQGLFLFAASTGQQDASLAGALWSAAELLMEEPTLKNCLAPMVIPGCSADLLIVEVLCINLMG